MLEWFLCALKEQIDSFELMKLRLRRFQLFTGLKFTQKSKKVLIINTKTNHSGIHHLSLFSQQNTSLLPHAKLEIHPVYTRKIFSDSRLSKVYSSKQKLGGIYSKQLFHKNRFQGLRSLIEINQEEIIVMIKLTSSPKKWMSSPENEDWFIDPVLIDSAFQACVLWCWKYLNRPSLPTGFDSFRCYSLPSESQSQVIKVKIKNIKKNKVVTADIFFYQQGVCLAEIQNYQAISTDILISAYQKRSLSC